MWSLRRWWCSSSVRARLSQLTAGRAERTARAVDVHDALWRGGLLLRSCDGERRRGGSAHLEQVTHPHGEACQDVPTIELGVRTKQRPRAVRPMDLDRTDAGPDNPHLTTPRLEKITDAPVDIDRFGNMGDNLNGEHRRSFPEPLRRWARRHTIPCDEAALGNANRVGVAFEHAAKARKNDAEVVVLDEVPERAEQIHLCKSSLHTQWRLFAHRSVHQFDSSIRRIGHLEERFGGDQLLLHAHRGAPLPPLGVHDTTQFTCRINDVPPPSQSVVEHADG